MSKINAFSRVKSKNTVLFMDFQLMDNLNMTALSIIDCSFGFL